MSRLSTVVAVVLSLATAHAVAAQDNPPTSKFVEVWKPHIAKRGNTHMLVHGINSTAPRDRFWALVEVNNPDGSRKCEWLKMVEPRQRYRFECPLQNPGGEKYESRVRVYSDAKLEDREMLYEPVLAVTPQLLSAAKPADTEGSSVPDGVFEAIETPLPVTFKSTWYRRLDRGFGMRAYENSGDFTVSADALVFVDGKKTVRIPHAQILSVRWKPLPNDIANHWLVVRFTNDEASRMAWGSATARGWAPEEIRDRSTRPCDARSRNESAQEESCLLDTASCLGCSSHSLSSHTPTRKR